LLPSQGTTSATGKITSTYKVNDKSGVVTITADTIAVTGGPTLTATVQIQKIVETHDLEFTVVANPTSIDLGGSQLWSTITVTLRKSLLNGSDTVPAGQKVGLTILGGGNFAGNITELTIGTNGTATTTYLPDNTIGTALIEAIAVIPNIGPIKADPYATISKTPAIGTTKTLNITAPVEGNNRYDYLTQNKVLVIVIGKNDTTPLINNWFKINSSNQIVGLPQISVSTNKIYDVWVKATNHLAVATTFSGATASPIDLTMLTAKIGDINLTHDNRIDSLDFSVFNLEFAHTPVFGDFNGDTRVDSLDFSFLNWNWGWGVDKPVGVP